VISVVIPVRNAARTLEVCLGAACAAAAACGGEVVVADDGSTDDSAAIAARHPCRVVRPPQGARGAGAARNAGARAARGGTLFFTDADCVLGPDTLALAAGALAAAGPRAVVGGTYASRAFDRGFFPDFQAAFVHFHETRRPDAPDYLATHALAISAVDFRDSGGFPEAFLPILEDVEFSHRLRRAGWRLRMAPAVQVRHSFGFDLAGSLRNAARKTRHWTRYSIGNRDLLADSGTASRGLKAACALWGLALAALATAALARSAAPLLALPVLLLGGLAANAGLVRAFFAAGGPAFGAGATLYLLLVYPAAIAVGAAQALVDLARRGGP
jgi:glycosyltransferase involved in cell wall biosynthesis